MTHILERVLICGDRHYTDGMKIAAELRALKNRSPDVVICHGAARGADSLAGEEAAKRGIPVITFPADWKRYGKRAGPIRNRQMLKEFAPTLVLAFHDNIDISKGTADMVKIARAAGIPTFVFTNRAGIRGSHGGRIPKGDGGCRLQRSASSLRPVP